MATTLSLASDYQEGAHPDILARLSDTNLERTSGYGTDIYCEAARAKIRKACECDTAAVHFLVGGTQANATVIRAMLPLYQGVIAAETGHINGHEAGAVEAGGHKVLALPQRNGKLQAEDLLRYVTTFEADENRDHLVMPGMVYLSQPTEYGTLYSLKELTEISRICREHRLYLYVDGARLAYALAGVDNDVTLPDLARLCDAFYIGGTKCGTLFGEAVVLPDPDVIPHFFTIIKQSGALTAKGRILGLQFDTLFTGNLYGELGKAAVRYAVEIGKILTEKGIPLVLPVSTNQVFPVLTDAQKAIFEQYVTASFWEKPDDSHTVLRVATGWATTEADVERFREIIETKL